MSIAVMKANVLPKPARNKSGILEVSAILADRLVETFVFTLLSSFLLHSVISFTCWHRFYFLLTECSELTWF
ncbi:hypothetical protein KC19_VG240800 [Ceratodon purpureus]|uniref:Uncharacterized protein n=1 Tax=Ceratodon purpureus TaxID=3225 RepID=A0A8T0HTK4_CERPU|nr:hypothetical protein KC19_VG240800 [Ceratodon purpureus]